MEQISLFPLLEKHLTQPNPPPNNIEAVEKIVGLEYVADYITDYQHDWLLEKIDSQEWDYFSKRRVQHYGGRYDYETGELKKENQINELPEWLNRLSLKLYKNGHMSEVPNQVLVSEYEPGQGIGGHIDKEPWFKDTIIILSLGTSCIMEFTKDSDRSKKIPVWLGRRSIAVLKKAARYEWMHGIPARKSDMWKGRKFLRQRRVSLSFRRTKLYERSNS